MSNERDEARRAVLREWKPWTAQHPDDAKGALASLMFLKYLQDHKSHLVDFSLKGGEERSQVVNGWLKSAGYI